MEVFKLYHNNPNVKTLQEFCQISGIYFDNDNSSVKDKYKIENFFEDNKQRIFDQMDMSERLKLIEYRNLSKKVTDLTADDLVLDFPLPCPITLVIPKRLVTYTMSAKHSTLQEPVYDTIALEDAYIKTTLLEENIKYLSFSAKRERAKCTVIGFFKTLYYNKLESSGETDISNGIYQTKSNFTDISDFIFQLTTNVGQQGGSFSFSLPHVPMYRKSDNEAYANPSDNYDDNVFNKMIDIRALREEMFNIAGDDNKYAVVKAPIDSQDYFNWLISPNDLIFISYDEISPDAINDDNIAGNTFDMIGLVDSVTLTRDAQGNISVNVSGKDLMKLLSDDSSVFFPNSAAVNRGNFFDNVEGALRSGDLSGVYMLNGKYNTETNRIPVPSSGAIKIFMEECNGFSIDYIIKVVIRQLVNMQVCPSEIFSSWKDRRTKFANFVPNKDKDKTGKKKGE